MVESADGLSSLLRRARKGAGWTQAELAQKANVSASVVQKTEASTGYNLGKRAGRQLLDALREHIEADLLQEIEAQLRQLHMTADTSRTAHDQEDELTSRLEHVLVPDVFNLIVTQAEREWIRLSDAQDKRRYVEFLFTLSGMVLPASQVPAPMVGDLVDLYTTDRSRFVSWLRNTGTVDQQVVVDRAAALALSLVAWLEPRKLPEALQEKGHPSQAVAELLPKDWFPEDVRNSFELAAVTRDA